MAHKKKRSYPTRAQCITAILRASRRTGMGFRPYFCRECKAWHMTKEKRW